ncbi:MAG: radical SAM protein [Acidaminococcaceae bacterium]|nr:radical SAM protein [Acidaminococcaceae bacterium]
MSKIIPVFIPHAGCPHQCIFCNQRTISGQKESGINAAREQIEKYAVWTKLSAGNELAFYGGSFTALPFEFQEELLKLAMEYRIKGLIGKIRVSTRPDYINSPVLALLKQYGVKTVELGAQSLDDSVLAKAERGHTGAQVAEAVKLLKAEGFIVGMQFMVGLPAQDWSSVKKTLQQAIELRPDIARIYPLLVVRGTALAKSYAEGEYKPLTIEEAVEQSFYLYEGLTQAGVKVIRIGLQPDKELCQEGNILAGPFHPSFGELVKSYGYKIVVQKQIDALPVGAYEITITHPPKLASIVRGMHKPNVKAWEADGKVKIKFKEGQEFQTNIVCLAGQNTI